MTKTMIIAEFKMGFPVFRYESSVTHYSRRAANAIERVTLRMVEEHADNQRWNGVPLSELFETMLKTPLPDIMVRPVVEGLVDVGVIRTSAPVTSLSDVTLAQLELTERGRELLRTHEMPVQSRRDMVVHFYDPIRDSLIPDDGNQAAKLVPNQPPMARSSSPFENSFPATRIAAQVLKEPHTWVTPSTEVERVEQKREAQTLWKLRKAQIEYGAGGALRILCQDAAYCDHLNRMSGAEMSETVLSRLFPAPTCELPALPGLTSHDLAASKGGLRSIDTAIGEMSAPGGAYFVGLPELLPPPSPVPPGSLAVVFGASEIRSEWNERGTGAVLQLPLQLPESPCCVYGKAGGSGLLLGELPTRYQEETSTIPVALTAERDHAGLVALWERVVDEVAGTDNPDVLLTLFLALPFDDAWERVFCRERFATCRDMLVLKERLAEICGKKVLPAQWGESFADAFADEVADAELSDSNTRDGFVALLKEARLQGECKARAVAALIKRLPAPRTVDQLVSVAGTLEDVGGSLRFPSDLHTDALIRGCLQNYTSPALRKINRRSAFEDALVDLDKRREALLRKLHVDSLSSDTLEVPSKRAGLNAVKKALTRCRDSHAHLHELLGEKNHLLDGAPPEILHDRLLFLQQRVAEAEERLETAPPQADGRSSKQPTPQAKGGGKSKKRDISKSETAGDEDIWDMLDTENAGKTARSGS